MGVGFHVRTNVRDIVEFRRKLESWARNELPFVQAASLTDTAKDAVSYLRNGLVTHFRIRNPGVRNGLTYEPADKRGHPIQAKVGTREWAAFLTLHAIGGTKKSAKGHRIAIPTRLVKRTARGSVPQRFKPRRLRESKGFDPAELERRQRIVVRKGKRAIRARVVFFNLVRRAHIRKRWPFEEEVQETVEARLPVHYLRRMEQALRP